MSQEMKNRINELRNFQAIITKKLLNKFGIYDKEAIDEWGWFIDPEINYYKPQLIKYISIPTTIQEEKSNIRSTAAVEFSQPGSSVFSLGTISRPTLVETMKLLRGR